MFLNPLCCQCQMGAVDVTIRIACGISQIQLMISTEINIIMDPRFIYAWKEFKVEKGKKKHKKNRNILELNVIDKNHLESKLKASLLRKLKSILTKVVIL